MGIGKVNHVIKPTEVVEHLALWSLTKCLLIWFVQGYRWVVE